jgi:hypothetical protein
MTKILSENVVIPVKTDEIAQVIFGKSEQLFDKQTDDKSTDLPLFTM